MSRAPFLLLPLLLACQSADQARIDDVLALTGDVDSGAALYATHCAECHGAAGEGGSGGALAGEGEDAEELVEVILFGDEEDEDEGGEEEEDDEDEEDEGTMPAFEEVLTDQEVADIVAWLQAEVMTGEDDDD